MTGSQEEQDRIATEAARWLVALEEDPDNAALLARFETWRRADPEHEVAWLSTSDIYDLMAHTTPVHAANWQRPVTRPRSHARRNPPGRRPSMRRRAAASLVAATIAACLALIFLPGLVIRFQADHVTQTAEVQTLRLEDGSIVRLAPDSAIDVAFRAGERRVHLLKGEAFFEVRPDPQRPFRVVARDVETTVLGTSFNVRLMRDGAEVSVRSGLVAVDTKGRQERLEVGDWVQVGWNGVMHRGGIPRDEVAPWLHGQIVARDRPLADVVDELRRYFPGAIAFAASGLGSRRVTGVYNLADPASALRAVVGTHGGSVSEVTPWLLVIRGG
ncbi:FecR family protein [Reyranella sp.]|uniref:FecR family protein n=1 Tax=Reyranella sp. TaxID=1929291 RepID=UPI0025F4F5C7|nr:FecR family protein [Reyranella sp.]